VPLSTLIDFGEGKVRGVWFDEKRFSREVEK